MKCVSKYEKWVDLLINEIKRNPSMKFSTFCRTHGISHYGMYDYLRKHTISVSGLKKKYANDCNRGNYTDSSGDVKRSGQTELFFDSQEASDEAITGQTKTCGVCGRTLPISQFYANSETSDGIGYRCKECNLKQRRKTNTENRKATDIKEFSDEALCGELRRRGFVGELSYCKTINI